MTTAIGRFDIRRELGRGAQSIVYLAFDPQLQREVAIKTLLLRHAEPARRQALLAEARAAGTLKHPNLVPIYDIGEQDGDPYLVFEFVDGPTLGELIARDGRLPAALAADLMRQVLDAVAQAHAAGIVHRDLKPSNILIDVGGRPRVTDFGIAGRLDAVHPDGTGKGAGLLGTPAYLAPEYVIGQQSGPLADVYAAGLILLEMITGKRVVDGTSLAEIVRQIATRPVTIPPEAGIDDTLAAIILKACAADPAARLPSAAAFKAQLDDYMGAAATPIVYADGGAQDDGARARDTLRFLLRRMRHKADFPALSDSVAAINRLTNSDREGIAKLASTILKDYALTNKILRLVNAPAYRGAGAGSISTVSRAVMVLGFDAVRNIMITVLLFDHLQDKANARELKEAFLRASLAAAIARDTGKQLLPREVEEGYICALFHNLGQLLAQYYFPEEVLAVRKLMVQQRCGEQQAAQRVLGISFAELGMAIAEHWGFPEPILASLRPLPEGAVKKATTPDEALRVLAGFANELRDAIAEHPKEQRHKLVESLRQRWNGALALSEKQVLGLIESAYEELTELASALHVPLTQSPFIGQVRSWAGAAQGGQAGKQDALSGSLLGDPGLLEQTQDPREAVAVPDDALAMLTAGNQDISNAMLDDFALNDILRMAVETMYRAMGFARVLLCLKDARADAMVARHGLGEDSAELVKHFRFPLAYAPDVFYLATSKGADIIIADIDEAKIADKIPPWFRQYAKARTFVLFPMNIKGKPLGLIYCDRDKPGSIVLPERELSLLKMLRNQAVSALKQTL